MLWYLFIVTILQKALDLIYFRTLGELFSIAQDLCCAQVSSIKNRNTIILNSTSAGFDVPRKFTSISFQVMGQMACPHLPSYNQRQKLMQSAMKLC